MGTTAGLGGLDDGGDVKGVAIDGDAAFDEGEWDGMLFEVAMIGAEQGGELSAGGVATDDDTLGIAAVLADVLMHPGEGVGDIGNDVFHDDIWQQAVIDGDEDEALVGEKLGLEVDAGFVARLPTAAVNPKQHGQVRGVGGGVDVEHVAFVTVFDIGLVALHGGQVLGDGLSEKACGECEDGDGSKVTNGANHGRGEREIRRVNVWSFTG